MSQSPKSDTPVRTGWKGWMILLSIAFVAYLPSFLIIVGDHPALQGAWWKILLGPFSWYFVTWAGKGEQEGSIYIMAGVCVALLIPAVKKPNSNLARLLFFVGCSLWFLNGCGSVMAWK